jgi:hypothetical protein
MKALVVSIMILVAAPIVLASPKQWSESEAIAEAERDIRANRVKFYWWGGYAPQPVVPDNYFRLARQYPRVDTGQGCLVHDEALNERQRKYAETYNACMLRYVLKKK